jgi:hypothetical protein
MSEQCVIGASVEAFGHPSECQEPASGEVVSTASHGISVTVNGTSREVATIASADISLPSHAHDYSSEDGCHQNESHTLDPSGEASITINGSPIYLVENNAATDPTSGGAIDIRNNPTATGITKK